MDTGAALCALLAALLSSGRLEIDETNAQAFKQRPRRSLAVNQPHNPTLNSPPRRFALDELIQDNPLSKNMTSSFPPIRLRDNQDKLEVSFDLIAHICRVKANHGQK